MTRARPWWQGRARTPLIPYQVYQARAYIERHCTERLTLAQLAARVGISRSHLAHCFPKAFGITVQQYLLACRVALAQRLLSQTELPLAHIAREIGCHDHSHFSALFRRHVGVTPQRYRHLERARRYGALRPSLHDQEDTG